MTRTSLATAVRRDVESAALPAAAEAGRAVQAAVARGQRPPWARVRRSLAEAMLYAYLLGLKRARQTSALRLSAHGGAVELLRARLNLSPGQLRELAEAFDASALRVVRDASDAAERRVERAILEATERGEHVRGGVALLEQAYRDAGLTPANSYSLEAVYRTQTQLAYGAAQWQAGEDDPYLWGYQYSTVGDDRVRPSHALLEGVTLPRDHPAWDSIFPPNGWGCRCAAIALYDEAEVVEPPEGAGADEGFAYNPGLVLRAARTLAAAYDPGQPRAPEGSPEGGRWVSGTDRSTVVLPGAPEEVKKLNREAAHAYRMSKRQDLTPEEREEWLEKRREAVRLRGELKRQHPEWFKGKGSREPREPKKLEGLREHIMAATAVVGGEVTVRDPTHHPAQGVKMLSAVVDETTRMRAKFPGLERKARSLLVNVVFVNDSDLLPGGANGDYNVENGQIRLSLHGINRVEDRLTIGSWHPTPESAAGTWRHEYGHNVWHNAMTRKQQQKFMTFYLRTPLPRIKATVGEYACKNAGELFAESFRTYTYKGYQRGALPQELESALDEVLR